MAVLNIPSKKQASAMKLTALGMIGALSLSACSLFENPTPDPTLVELAATASSDATYFEAEAQAGNAVAYNQSGFELRSTQQAELITMIQDVCGRNEANQLPESCEHDAIDTEIAAATAALPTEREHLDAAASQLWQNFVHAPAASWPLLIEQFQQLRELGAANPASTTNVAITRAPTEDVTAATEYLYQASYALGVVAAFGDADVASQATDMLALFQQQIGVLQAMVSNGASPAVAYEFTTFSEPVDADTAAETLAQITAGVQQLWQHEITDSSNAQWQELCMLFVGELAAL
ncbi:MAG: hypothetical protein Q3976_05295 [Corynebacterium sp.]|nr:hypothetical protein [Corynebacterium sp.]